MSTPASPPPASPSSPAPPLVRLTQRIERLGALDHVSALLGTVSKAVTWEPLGPILRGKGTGHAIHPVLTDLPIGFWTSATVLDLVGGARAQPAARRLTGLGLASVVPTAASGLAEWALTDGPETRVGSLHAALNLASVGGYALSYGLRVRGRHLAAAGVALVALGIASGAGYLGGHLVTVRKTGSRDPAFEHDGVGPVVASTMTR